MPIQTLVEQRFGTPPDSALPELEDPFFQRLLGRGAVRDFLPGEISDGLFDVLLACALSASSKSDLQQASVVEIRSRDQRAAVADLVPGIAWVRTAPRFLIFCGDARRFEEIAAYREQPLNNATVEGFLNATVDAALVMQTFILASEAAGLGCCPVSNLRYRGEELAELLKLPDRVFPIAGLAVGHPSRPPRIKPRLPRALTVHRDTYTNSVLNALDDYDRLRGPSSKGDTWSAERAAHPDADKAAAFARYLAEHGFPFARK
jgi:nitroreductase/FMN reductase [NAD(P)H]